MRGWEGTLANCTKCGQAIVTETGFCGACGAAAPAAWKFGWSPWIGITYGPVPVGLILAVIILIGVNQ